MTTYTPNFHLPLYEDSDKPNLRDQYNGAVSAIDTQMRNFDADYATVNNLITNINREIDAVNTSLTTINGDIEKLNTLTTAQGTSIETQGQAITKAQADITTNAQGIATQDSYWSALNVSSLDEAIDLSSDITDTHTTAMTNQADIATMKVTQGQQANTLATHTGQINNLGNSVSTINSEITMINGSLTTISSEFERTLAEGFEVTELSFAAPSGSTPRKFYVFINKAKTLWKIAGEAQWSGYDFINTLIQPIPGGSGNTAYGFKIADLSSVLPPIETAITYTSGYLYTGIGIYSALPGVGEYNISTSAAPFVIGTDLGLYVWPYATNAPWANTPVKYFRCSFIQQVLTLKPLDLEPLPPITQGDNA